MHATLHASCLIVFYVQEWTKDYSGSKSCEENVDVPSADNSLKYQFFTYRTRVKYNVCHLQLFSSDWPIFWSEKNPKILLNSLSRKTERFLKLTFQKIKNWLQSCFTQNCKFRHFFQGAEWRCACLRSLSSVSNWLMQSAGQTADPFFTSICWFFYHFNAFLSLLLFLLFG